MYSSTIPLTSTLDGVGWSTPLTGHFTLSKETRYSLYRKPGGSRAGLVGCGKISRPQAFDLLTVQPVATRYSDYAIPVYVF
jgi:hypothetical protein